jgi:ABC-2 type transport system permease protein
MKKILLIAWKDIYGTFTDRNLILIMLVTPLVLSTIIALAFSDLSTGGTQIEEIPVAIVNQDTGDQGAIFVSTLTGEAPPASTQQPSDCPQPVADEQEAEGGNTLLDLTETTVLDDPAAARTAVNNGEYAAAIIIPADFSERITYTGPGSQINPPPVEVYGDNNRPISANVIRSVTLSITNQVLTGQIAVASTLSALGAQAANVSDQAFCAFSAAFDPSALTISVEQQTLTGEEAETPNLLVEIGSAQAAFFALFTAFGTSVTILEERRNGTLQRMIVSPTRRIEILLGKLLAVFGNVLLQIIFLFLALTLIGSLLEGELTYIWGTNWIAIAALVLVTSLAAAGVGMVAAAAANNIEQANVIGSVIALLMGLLGGAFFQLPELPALFDLVTRLSIVRWGAEGFAVLADGGTDILPNVLALAVIGFALFLISLVAFNRRQDI